MDNTLSQVSVEFRSPQLLMSCENTSFVSDLVQGNMVIYQNVSQTSRQGYLCDSKTNAIDQTQIGVRRTNGCVFYANALQIGCIFDRVETPLIFNELFYLLFQKFRNCNDPQFQTRGILVIRVFLWTQLFLVYYFSQCEEMIIDYCVPRYKYTYIFKNFVPI